MPQTRCTSPEGYLDSISHDSILISDNYFNDLISYFKSKKQFLNLTIPNYSYFLNDTINSILPIILFDDNLDSMSFPCLNCENDQRYNIRESATNLTWLITSKIQSNAITNPPFTTLKYIINCVANKNPSVVCNYCPSTSSTIGSLPQYGNNVNNWELGIRNRNTNSNHSPYGNNGNDNCLIVTSNPSTNPPTNAGAYAVLRHRSDILDAFKIVRYNCGVPNFAFHSEKAVKITYPLVDFQNTGGSPMFVSKAGNIMTLCENYINPFVNYSENDANSGCGSSSFNWRFAAAYGFYQINRPTGGSNGLPTLYFAYPYSNGIWWGNSSPDMTVLFDHEYGVEPCSNPLLDHVKNWYGVDGCSMCSAAGLSLALPNGTAKDLLVNDDPNVIINYWNTPKIQIGLKNGPNSLAWSTSGNLFEFGTTTTPYQCPTWNPTILLSTFTLLPGNEYEVLKPIDSNGTLYPPNTVFYIDVKVNFQNGSTIERKECISSAVSVSCATIQLFSKIKNYDPNTTNYEIKIYR